MIYDNTHNDGLYNPQFEHDNCGIGAIVNIKGIKTHKTVENALSIVERMPKARPVTVSALCFRYPINFSPRHASSLE